MELQRQDGEMQVVLGGPEDDFGPNSEVSLARGAVRSALCDFEGTPLASGRTARELTEAANQLNAAYEQEVRALTLHGTAARAVLWATRTSGNESARRMHSARAVEGQQAL